MEATMAETRQTGGTNQATSTFVGLTVSVGEALDRFSILHIKASLASDDESLHLIRNDMAATALALERAGVCTTDLDKNDTYQQLTEVNQEIWDLREQLHAAHNRGSSDIVDVSDRLANSLPDLERRRYRLQRQLSRQFNSELQSVKSYM